MGSSKSKEAKQPENKKRPPPPKKEITAQERAVLDLKNQRDKLHRYKKQLEANITKETQFAKQALASGNKQRALLFLKKKKYQEGLLEKAEKQQDTIEEMVNAIEFAALEREVFERLKEGKDMLEAINKEMSVEEVERLMDDTREAVEYQEQISAALGAKLTEDDEEDVLKELEALEALESSQTVEQQLKEAPKVPDTPLPETVKAEATPDKPSEREAAMVPA